MKRILALLLAVMMVLALGACTNGTTNANTNTATTAAEPVELIVFAAASMTETLTTIAEQYKTVAPNVTLTYIQ